MGKNMTLNGCDPFTLQKMGGWADIRTMRRYIQMDTSDMRNSHDEYSPASKFVKNVFEFATMIPDDGKRGSSHIEDSLS